MAGYQRPEGGWRYNFGGLKTNSPADVMQPTKYPIAINIRSYLMGTVHTRPGYAAKFTTAADPILEIGSYTDLLVDSLPRFLARSSSNKIWLDDNNQVGTLDGSSQVASFIPFRPNSSPQPWMYIGVSEDYKKYSVPGFGDGPAPSGVFEYKVGIQEPMYAPDICPDDFSYVNFSSNAAAWAQGGTAGAITDTTRLTDTAGDVLEDPASYSVVRSSVEVTSTDLYQRGMIVTFDAGGTPKTVVVQDVLPPITLDNLVIDSIIYFNGTTGRCVIVPAQSPADASVPRITGNIPAAASIFSSSAIAGLRRGSLVNLDNGSTDETVFVLSTTIGPDGTVCFECVTNATYAVNNQITGIPAISVSQIDATYAGKTIGSADITSAFTTGVGTLSQTLGTNPFETLMNSSGVIAQQDDYVGFSLRLSDILALTKGRLIFSVDAAGASYDKNYYYYEFTAADLIGIPVASAPALVDQYFLLFFPITSLRRFGTDLSKTLADCNGVQLSLTVSANVTVRTGSFFLGGGGAPDVGAAGSPYFYIIRGRSSRTGAVGNPSPITRYGVSPRRQTVSLLMVDTILDPQLDTWDIFRYGGSVPSFRYIGSMGNSGGGVDVFIDSYFDSSALRGSLAEYDNYEPWPSIYIPFNPIAGAGDVTTTIQLSGTLLILIYSAAAPFDLPYPYIDRMLPGNILIFDGKTAYTLRSRPIAISLSSPPAVNYYAFQFELVQNAGPTAPGSFLIREPNIARQTLPYLFGPDAYGTVFGVGDQFRPGNVYFSKSNNPDSAPATYNLEITPPTEPLIGGEVIVGRAMVASSDRWWGLNPTFGSTQRYQAIDLPVGRGMAAPAHCTDGKNVFFVAKDGIWRHSGGVGVSMTDDDLSNLFPQEGSNAPVNYVYATYTVYAPDYKYASLFRLSCLNGYLYFDYRDSTGAPKSLVCNYDEIDKPVWMVDVTANGITSRCAIKQPESSLLSTSTLFDMLILGASDGNVFTQTDRHNDNATAISPVIACFEYDGGDLRKKCLFDDFFLDMIPISQVQAAATNNRATVTAFSTFAASAARLQSNVPIGQELQYCGAIVKWTDDFTIVSTPTTLISFQPRYQGTPISVFQWTTQFTAFGYKGFMHGRQMVLAYKSTATVTFTITTYDGTSPAVITLPSTGGAVKKVQFPYSFNKGLLYKFSGVSSAQWQPYLSESEIWMKEWGSTGPYQLFKDIEAASGISS